MWCTKMYLRRNSFNLSCVFVYRVCLRGQTGSPPCTSHLVRRALGDTKATRSVCERLLERKISSLPLWEEVPRKTEPMNGDGASMCMCTIGWKCVCVCLHSEGGGAQVIVLLGIQIYHSNNICFHCDNIMAVIDSVPLYYVNTQLMLQ